MLNLDFAKHVVIDTSALNWQTSPSKGVNRKLLARENIESGHATSIVQYDAGTSFSEHLHPKGEEIFVLEGVFSDEHGDYPAGTYLRNPPNSKHAPFSNDGCVLFVKLAQFLPDDTQVIRINTTNTHWGEGQGRLKVMPLFSHIHEHVALVKWPAGERFQPHRHFGGEEILVLSGEFQDEHGRYPKGTWIRSPHMSSHFPFVEEDTVILVKTGHLYIDKS